MKRRLGIFYYAILAGIFISFGGVAYLSVYGNKLEGAVLFSAGLYTVVTLKYELFTGKVGYLFDHDPRTYIPDLLIVYIGNFIGAFLLAFVVRFTRIYPMLFKAVEKLAHTKLNDTPLSIFILSILCNIFVVLAVEQYRNNPHEFGKYLGILYGIIVFVVVGYEHVVANMFYFSLAGTWSKHTWFYILIMTLGNIVGGVLIPSAKKIRAYLDS